MQSKILDFEIDGRVNAALYGDYSDLRPFAVSGVAHAFRTGTSVILTLYSETGISANGAQVCSADARLVFDVHSLRRTIDQLMTIERTLFPEDEISPLHTPVPIEPEKVEDELGPPL